ncbi:MAG: DUF4189 domain-containing protein [Pseudanabaena sp.]|jgi:hypothetical protein
MKKYLGFIAATFLLVEGIGASAAMAGEWGAVATGPNRAYGWAVDYPTEEAAKAAALSNCEGGCTDGVSFHNSCASIATGGGYFGWATSASKSTAISNAINECGGSSVCSTKVWGCSGSDTTD